MNDLRPPGIRGLFDDLTPTPAEHFRVHLYGAILRLLAHTAESLGTFEQALQRFPFLAGYHNQLADRVEGLSAAQALTRWFGEIEQWESRTESHLPLRSVRLALSTSPVEIGTLLTLGLIDEDSRFGDVFEALDGSPGSRRLSFSLLRRLWGGQFSPDRFLERLAAWRSSGLVDVPNAAQPRADWTPQIPPSLWDALTGATPAAFEGFRFQAPTQLKALDQLVLPQSLVAEARAVPGLLASGEIRAVIVRGPLHNGRHTLLEAFAKSLGKGVLECPSDTRLDITHWRRFTALGLALNALPILSLDLAPGEVFLVPDPAPALAPVGIVLGFHGGIAGTLVESALTFQIDLPGSADRLHHWIASLPDDSHPHAPEFSEGLRLGSGNIRRLAQRSQVRAHLAGRRVVTRADVSAAARTLNREALDSLAHHLPPIGDLDQLRTGESTWRELLHLEQRCRHRERLTEQLAGAPGGGPGCGVRALLSGPSGTGKTLAARLLAARLGRDLYRLDLSAVVNKYIGETEKNLNRVFDRAEDLDVILLLDEGDALLTRRTDVQTSNDRYANLETNFLLQRLESFQGIVLVTTNARERIDSSFERRMDVIIEFHPPDTEERWDLWQAHLPADRSIDDRLLREIATRCQLNGGQIRNAALHASLLALGNGGLVTESFLEAAVRREYLKIGGVCPLRG